jgi:hypothetical protein
MCCRSCAECSCDHRGIITRQNEIIARQEREITWQKEFIGDRVRETARQEGVIARQEGEIAREKERARHFELMMKGYIEIVDMLNKTVAINDAEIAALKQPPCIEPLSNAARAALDVVCKRDADDRVESQRATIARLRQELAAKDTKINNFKRGINVAMGDIWVQHGILYPAFSPNQEHRTSRQDLHSFLQQVRQGLETQMNRALDLHILFPTEGEATEDEADNEDDNDDEDRASA